MNRQAFTLSILMAIIAVFFVESYVSSLEEAERKRFGTEVTVFKATKDIKEMETITEQMIEQQPIPKSFLEPSAIYFEAKPGDKNAPEELVRRRKSLGGYVAIVPIKKGEQIAYSNITEPGIRTGLSPQVTPGKRGFTVPVNEVSGVGKLVKPGDRIDLITVLDTGNGKEGKIAKTLFQDLIVLAVGKNVTNNVARIEGDGPAHDKVRSLTEDTTFNSVTLEVDPNQAQALALLLSNGDNSMMLSLRNNDDTDRTASPATMLFDVLGPDAARVPRKPASVTR
jgi:pilus assembly protein CpaB